MRVRCPDITGNLIGTELTQVAPLAGHAFLMLFDLLISTWSLSLAGFALGLLGGLSMVNNVVDGINQKAEWLSGGSQTLTGRAEWSIPHASSRPCGRSRWATA